MEKDKKNSLELVRQRVEKHNNYFVFLSMTFICVLILSNISASNVMYFNEYLSLSAAEILFPISYVLNDILVEIYGFKKIKKVIWVGLFLALFSTVFLYVTTLLPTGYTEYQTVFGFLTSGMVGITIASFIAYLIGSLANGFIMSKMKDREIDKNKHFFKRAITSSVIAELLDSLVFITCCCIFASQFYFWDKLISLVFTIFLIKITVEILVFPITNKIRKVMNKNLSRNK